MQQLVSSEITRALRSKTGEALIKSSTKDKNGNFGILEEKQKQTEMGISNLLQQDIVTLTAKPVCPDGWLILPKNSFYRKNPNL